MELVARLMNHYWTADDHPAMRQAQAEDWLEDLAELPPEVVAAACREWRQSSHKRPTPHDIRSLAIAEQRKRNPEPEPVYLRPQSLCERTPEEIAYVEKCIAQIKSNLGAPSALAEGWPSKSGSSLAQETAAAGIADPPGLLIDATGGSARHGR